MLIKTPQQWDLTQDRVFEEGEMQRVAPQLTAIVAHSFVTHPMRHPTTAEHKRRVDATTRIYFEFRRDKRWTEAKSINHVRAALVAELNTQAFNARDRGMYARDTLLFPDAGSRPAIALIDGARGDGSW